MILLAHPFGNANVRAVLATLHEAGLLAKYFTTLGWSNERGLRASWPRRGYKLPNDKIVARPMREIVRLLAGTVGLRVLVKHERGWASIDRVWRRLDEQSARYLRGHRRGLEIDAVYAYEDCALDLFKAAGELGARRIYDLPIAYWETTRRLLREEAERHPEWEPTLGGTRDSEEKLARKTRELELAELVICPSNFVFDSLPVEVRAVKPCAVVPFGAPAHTTHETNRSYAAPLRVLFTGALTQRKGLADLFVAMKLVNSRDIELVVMGSLLQPLSWYRAQFSAFTYEAPRPHAEVLRLMQSCDLLVLPSIVEGRALVQQEAMACGLPVIATKNAGADDLIVEDETGFLIPIRSPEAIAEKISWCAGNRATVAGMGIAAQDWAAKLTWRGYGEKVLAAIRALTGE